MVEHPDPSRPDHVRRLYRPLDVVSWNDAARVIIGWFMVIVLAVVSGGLFAIYEMLVINVGDTDLRVMQYDYRINNVPTSYYHWHFVNGISCCNQDPVVDSGKCFSSALITEARLSEFRAIPECPPIAIFQCYDLTDSFCNQTRAVVYDALGVSPNGQYSNCSSGGLVRVGAEEIAITRSTNLLILAGNGATLASLPYDIFSISTPETQASIQNFLYQIQDEYGATEGANPFTALGNEVKIDGTPALLTLETVVPQQSRNSIGRWPSAIFTFPGMNARCPETFTVTQFFLQGTSNTYNLSAFDYNRPQNSVSTLSFFNSSTTFAQWKVELYADGQVVQQNRSDWAIVRQIAALEVRVYMVAALGSCYNWAIDANSLQATYLSDPVWEGPAQDLPGASIPGRAAVVQVTVRDVSAPEYIALPPYSGMWYIVFCFLCAAFWVWGLGIWIVFGIPLIWWNVRSNAGKPPLVYRYMRRYRGW